MKNRLTTLDIVCLIQDLQQKLLGLRVDQIYDVDKKTYLIRLTKTDTKKVLLLESGTRFHTTTFEWPKNPAPSGFSMKLRKHLNNKRLEKITQLGADRIVDFQFGTEAYTHHIFLELYDKGNLVLTDHSFNILSLLRPRIQGEERFAAHENYAIDKVKQSFSIEISLAEELLMCSAGKSLREIFLSRIEFGPALFTHVLKIEQLAPSTKIPEGKSDVTALLEKLFRALENGRCLLENPKNEGGFIVSTTTATSTRDQTKETSKSFYDQFHPTVIVSSYAQELLLQFPSFDEAVDDFFSKVESQKLDRKQLTHEKEALKKLENVKLDQHKRLNELKEGQEVDKRKAEVITVNQILVDNAIVAIRKMVANQIAWSEIWEQIKDAQSSGDHLAGQITSLNLQRNHFSMQLSDPYEKEEDNYISVDIDLGLTAFGNATKYYDLKKASAKKEERTWESQEKALKSTERKTIASLREVATIHSIKKARKVLWFEKFRWFISSENFLVLAGRDKLQNEMLQKKHMKATDVYVHADTHGAPTVIIKNDTPSEPVPPKTLNESCCFAVCNSGSWESKIITSAWWVYGSQVSKSAPTGEYLPTGSFMIRGKKNYLPPCQLVLGFSFLFRLTDECIERHKSDRPRRVINAEGNLSADSKISKVLQTDEETEDLNEFPDTHVELRVDDRTNEVRTRMFSTSSGTTQMSEASGGAEDEESSFIVCGPEQTVSISMQKLKRDKKKADKKSDKKETKFVEPEPIVEEIEKEDSTQRTKRGQHGRKKKLKEKYKFQDEEERQLRMHLLQAGSESIHNPKSSIKTVVASKVNDDVKNSKEDVVHTVEVSKQKVDIPERKTEANDEVKIDVDDADGDGETESPGESELDFLNCLTGVPLEEDELLFAIPMVAPYTTLQSYKFRIKMIPGTNKRGKAARSALESFIKDKAASQREKDLFKSVKDQDLARNFPGKVKLSFGPDKSK